MTRETWLKNLKRGDKVIVRIYGAFLYSVKRVTKNFIFVEKMKFKKEDGFSISGDAVLEKPDRDNLEEIETHNILDKIEEFFEYDNYCQLNISQLRKIGKLIDNLEAQS